MHFGYNDHNYQYFLDITASNFSDYKKVLDLLTDGELTVNDYMHVCLESRPSL